MKRSYKSVLGVTLLEIMLVLAIAAMIVVMSIRYYQSASANQKVASAADSVTAIVAAGETFFGAAGSYTAFSGGTAQNYLPNGTMPSSPWGGTAMTITAPGANTYTINITGTIPTGPCAALILLLTSQNTKLSGTCSAIVVTE